jgi:hypothetical protein
MLEVIHFIASNPLDLGKMSQMGYLLDAGSPNM